MHVLHSQHQRMAAWAEVMLLVPTVACLIGPVLASQPALRMTFLGLAALLLLTFVNFDRLAIMVTREELRVGFPVGRSRVPIPDITHVEPIQALSFWRWGGTGLRLRFGRNGGVGYIMRSGPAVRVKARGRGRDLVFTCEDPRAVIRALLEAGCPAREVAA